MLFEAKSWRNKGLADKLVEKQKRVKTESGIGLTHPSFKDVIVKLGLQDIGISISISHLRRTSYRI